MVEIAGAGFRRPCCLARVWGLDYPFTVPRFGSGCQVPPV